MGLGFGCRHKLNSNCKKKNQFGLMTIYEEILLPTEYDYITHCQDDIYLIVKNDLYGFIIQKKNVLDISRV